MAQRCKRNGRPNASNIRIRLYRPEDHEQVVDIFSQGMLGLAPTGVEVLVCNNRPLWFLGCAVPVAALLLTPRRLSLPLKAAIGISAATVLPLVVYGIVRWSLRKYVSKSLAEDLSCIKDFYSLTGAGHGSAFWIAELVEDSYPAAEVLVAATGSTETKAAGSVSRPVASAQEPVDKAQADEIVSTQVNAVTEFDNSEKPQKNASSPGHGHEPSYAAVISDVASDGHEGGALVSGLVRAMIAKLESQASDATAAAVCLSGPVVSGKPPDTPATAPGAAIESVDLIAVARPPNMKADAPASGKKDLSNSSASRSVMGRGTVNAPPSIIVGHVALQRKTWQQAELRRMSVAPVYRGLGIGDKLLSVVMQHARDNGFRELILYTSDLQLPARRMYEKAGWSGSEVSTWSGIRMFKYTFDLTKA